MRPGRRVFAGLLMSILMITQIFLSASKAATPSFTSANLVLNYDISDSSSYPGSGSTITDRSASGNNGATVSSPTYSSSNGGYLTFSSASNQWAYTGAINQTGFTMSSAYSTFMWIKLTGDGIILDERGQGAGGSGWQDSVIERVGGELRVGGWNSGEIWTAANPQPTANSWTYVGFVGNSNSYTIYVNGAAAGTFSRTTYPGTLYYTIGQADGTNMGNGGYGNFLFGALHVYKSALTAQEVANNYNATKARFLTPTITSFAPSSGGPGTTVTLTGTNMYGATAVNFNGLAATSFNVLSDTQTTAVVPSGSATGKITLVSGGSTATSATDYTAYIGLATIQLSLQGGGSTANKGKSSIINAALNTSGTVTFYANGRVINRCQSIVTATTTASCNWLPLATARTQLTAYINPTTTAYTAASSGPLYIQVLKRSGPR